MKRALVPLVLLLTAAGIRAQTADTMEFEVASIKPSPPPEGRGIRVSCTGGPGSKDPTLFTCENMSLNNLVCNAYEIAYYQLSAPDWGMQTRFHVNARVPAGATKEQFRLMLQKLLADRFKLVVHHETKDFQKYELVVAKGGPKLKPAAPPPAPKDDAAPSSAPAERTGPHLDKDGYPAVGSDRPGMAIMNGRARMYQPGVTMDRMAGMLAGQTGSPVTNATGLDGKYDISLYWQGGGGMRASASADGAAESEPGPTIFEAIQQQLGLKLESRKGPIDILVIDHAEKTPIEN